MKISKVKLINWHAFENETLKFTGNLIITGSNGSGKSTLMDAIYYVLSGGDTKNFNNAANNGDNHNSKRTLETYILHKIGDEGRECLRSRPIISHICIEFTSDSGVSFLLGAVIELSETSISEKFYTKDSAKIDDSMFISADNTIYDFSSLKRNASVFDITKTSKISRQRSFCKDVFKVNDGTRYMELLQRAIAFKPIDEVSDFVDSFLLGDNSIDITPLQEELRSYNGIHNQVRKAKEKIEFLEQFMDNANKYQKCNDNLKCLDPLLEEATAEYAEAKINELEKENENLSFKNSRLQEEIDASENEKERLEIEVKSIENSDQYQLVKSKKEELAIKTKDLDCLFAMKNHQDQVLRNEQSILKLFELNYSFYKDITDKNFNLFDQHRKAYSVFVRNKNAELISSRTRLVDKANVLKTEINDITGQISELQKHHSIYPQEVTKLRDLLVHFLKEKYGKDIIIKPLCELVEFKENEMNRWSNAIEAYLTPYRFGLIVDHKYYEECVHYYNQIKNQEHIYNVKIYNANAPLIFTGKVKENSIFSKLDIDDKRTKFICYQLFNEVICFDSLNDLINQDSNGILDNCIIYKEHSFLNPDPKSYKYPYIGENSFKTRIEYLNNELSEKEEEKLNIENEKERISDLIDRLEKNKASEISGYTDVWSEFDKLTDDVRKVKEDLKLYESNPGMIALTEKIQSLKNKEQTITDTNAQKRQNILDNQKNIGSNENEINRFKTMVNIAEKSFESKLLKYSLSQSVYESFRDDYYKDDGCLDKTKIENAKSICQNTIASLTNRLQDKVQEYVSKYNNNLSTNLADINAIINEYEKLKKWSINYCYT